MIPCLTDNNGRPDAGLFRFDRIDTIEVPADGDWHCPAQPGHAVVVCRGGTGSIRAERDFAVLRAREGYFLPPGRAFRLIAGGALSNEKLPEIDPDYILLINDNDEIYNELQNLALWKNMKAVKANQVYPIASDSWFGGYGPHAATSMLDDLSRLSGAIRHRA